MRKVEAFDSFHKQGTNSPAKGRLPNSNYLSRQLLALAVGGCEQRTPTKKRFSVNGVINMNLNIAGGR